MSFTAILQKYRNVSFTERAKGEQFERLIQAYFTTDPQFSFLQKVWMWQDFPFRTQLGGIDSGIDLVALTDDDNYWAIQCKCFAQDAYIDKSAVDSFLSTSSKEFLTDSGQTVRFSHRYWISTTNKWGKNAIEALENQNPAVTRLNQYDLENAPIDWDKLDSGITGEAARSARKIPLPHQKEAVEKTHDYFAKKERGKLIMACGTGKTYTSLLIAEHETAGKGMVLFLVPSIALLGQTLRAWTADASEPINAICICSDPEISRKKSEVNDTGGFSIVDLALPASTNTQQILRQFDHVQKHKKSGMTVVFSTYQSIDVISNAQKKLLENGYGEFDLIICDEAHRTTGVTLGGEDESAFVKVHNNDFLRSKKRLYMTATPRLFSDDTKSKAAQHDAELCSMDDEQLYGQEIYRIGFGKAVEQNLLTDYKVLILTMNESDVPPSIQAMITDSTKEIKADDAAKLIGCINALSKQVLGDDGTIQATDPGRMKRAVAFCPRIKDSQMITEAFNSGGELYLDALTQDKKALMVKVSSQHIDGTMNAPKRDELLQWLKDEPEVNECRILTNVRCLSEGVDVPNLDAVMFLSARNSQIDVVQSVGRVMRTAPGKKCGYIIIPIIVPEKEEASVALDDNERYKVVWTVLNALRAHDDRFNATVNKLELNKKKPHNINVVKPRTSFKIGNDDEFEIAESEPKYGTQSELEKQLTMQFEDLQSVIFAKLVKKVGDRRYLELWAKKVALIAERYIERITYLVEQEEFAGQKSSHKIAFEQFLDGLQKNINPSITQSEAIEMLAQHIITKPIFDALFENYSFVKNNPISVSMQTMLDLLEESAFNKDTEELQKFYEDVKRTIGNIDNGSGKQKIIVRLYDNFFKIAFPKMVERLGIVYTPIEVVDFIIHSVNDVLKKEFARTLSDQNVHILDPFTGTGTFITRLIQSELIKKEDLERKYECEIFANEIVLLAYYIAAVNIENAYHDAMLSDNYKPFDGICLTDSFQLGESTEKETWFSDIFKHNSERVLKQQNAPITVIMGNPPYSIGQKSANDNAQNQQYAKLEKRIEETYVKESGASLNKSAYDSYIKAFRWASDRLDTKNGGTGSGIIAFVSNGAWLDANGLDGFRKCIQREFDLIYVFNLRGNQRTSGELSRKEGGKIFGSGSRTPIAVTLLVKRGK